MKILFISEFFPSQDRIFLGGVQTRTYYVARHLSKDNEVIVVTNKESGKPSEEQDGKLKIIRTGSVINKPYATSQSIFKRFLFIFSAVKKGLELEFDIVEGSNFISHYAAFIVGFLKNKPKIAWYPDVLIGSWIKSFGLLSGIVGEVSERIILKLPWDRYIAISKSTAEKLEKRGVSSKRITVIGCGIDFEEFKNLDLSRKKNLTICTVARLVSYKRVDDLLLAFDQVKKKISHLKLQIIGDGPDYPKLKDQVEKLNIEKDVRFFTNLSRENFLKTLAKATVFALPSAIEGFGIAVIEAAALKIPYIVTDLPVFKEITHNAKGGLFYPVGDIKSLARNLELVILDVQLRRRLAEEAYLLSRNYNWEKVAFDTKIEYEVVLSGRTKR